MSVYDVRQEVILPKIIVKANIFEYLLAARYYYKHFIGSVSSVITTLQRRKESKPQRDREGKKEEERKKMGEMILQQLVITKIKQH